MANSQISEKEVIFMKKALQRGLISLILIAIALAPFILRILLRVGVIAPEVNILTIIAGYAPIVSMFLAFVAGAYIMEDFIPTLQVILPEKKEEKIETVVTKENNSKLTTSFVIYRATGDVPWIN